jgi:hypothetical protein
MANNLYSFESIKKIEIDCTSYCNAFCGACDRNIEGAEPHPLLVLSHFRKETWESLFTEENLQHVNEIIFNGNYGDFSMHPHIIEMLEYLNTVKSNLYINMHTNGTARDLRFWRSLATTLQKFTKHDIKFGIDGVESNHARYRRGLRWDKRIANLREFNQAGGNSVWKAIVFDYNVDDLELMEEYARAYGCMSFQTNRNRSGTITLKGHKPYSYSKPLGPGVITSPSTDDFDKYYRRKVEFRKHTATPISDAVSVDPGNYVCPYGQEGMIQVDPWGNMWPCCYISGRQLDRKTNFPYDDFDTNVERYTISQILDKLRPFLIQQWSSQSLDICNRCAGIKIPAPKY